MEKTARHVLSCCLPCLPSCTTPFFPQKRAWHTSFSLRIALFSPQAKTARHAVSCPLILSSEQKTCLFAHFPQKRPSFPSGFDPIHFSLRNALLCPSGGPPLSVGPSPFHSFFPQKRPPFPSGGPPLSVGPSPLSPGDRRQGTQDVGDKRYEIGGRRQETDQTGVRRQ